MIPLPITSLGSAEEFAAHYDRNAALDAYSLRENLEALIAARPGRIEVDGVCAACETASMFTARAGGDETPEGLTAIPNWREELVCRQCGLNNRVRAAIHLLRQDFQPRTTSRIYLTEQVTPLYAWCKSSFPETVGSEYLGKEAMPGQIIGAIQHQSLLGLSFDDESFDFVMCFDVLEHVPDFCAALKECRRVLAPHGKFLFTVPFAPKSPHNIVRARLLPDGAVDHLLPPEYHGDPVNLSAGTLCYYHFGWELLRDIRNAGFRSAEARLVWSREFCYLGSEQIMFVAER